MSFGIGEADERAVARRRRSPRSVSSVSDALADAALAIEEPHPHLGARVAAGVAVLDLPGDRVGGQTPRVSPLVGRQSGPD